MDRAHPKARLCCLDLDTFFVSIERVVWHMRDTIQSELGLPSSAGIGATRAVAKIASGLAKPAGVLLVRVGEEVRRTASAPQSVP